MDGKTKIYIGPAGWSYPDWKGCFYPEKPGRGFNELSYIARYFNLVEINSTYYHPQAVEASRRWIERVRVNPEFRFTAKLWQKFVLERSSYTADDVRRVTEGMDVLQDAGKLGALLLQFPQSFHHNLENRSWLFRLITEFRMYPLVVEVRHRSWDVPQVLEFLQENSVAIANIDQPVIGAGLGITAHLTASVGYFRFHGRNRANWFNEKASRDERYDYNYTQKELAELVARVNETLDRAEKVYIVFNNHFRGQAPKNAFEFVHLLEREKQTVPEPLLQAYPELAPIRRPDHPDQLELF